MFSGKLGSPDPVPERRGPYQLRVLSFNVWGLYYLGSVKIRERFNYISQELKKYDIVGLQEVWKGDDFKYIAEKLKDDLPYLHYFHSGMIGSGVCIFSRYPIMDAHTHVFTVSGSMLFPMDGELFAGKGILLCRIRTPAGLINFYNTHLNPRHRDSQCFEIYQFVQRTRGVHPVIMTGDYNTKPRHLGYNFLVSSLSLQDVFTDDPVDTCDLASNIYTKKHTTPKRIDFVFFSNQNSSSVRLRLKNRNLAVTGLIPGKDFPFSDHEGVEATFLVDGGKGGGQGVDEPDELCSYHPQDKDVMLNILAQLSTDIHCQQSHYKSSPPLTIALWVVVTLVIFLFSFFMDAYVHHLLVPYRLGWILFVCMALAGAMGVAFVMNTIVARSIYLALEANLAEIDTSLRYLRTTMECERQDILESKKHE